VAGRKAAAERVKSKISRMHKNTPTEGGKVIEGRTHKTHFPVMRTPKPYEKPEEQCAKRGHNEVVLAQSPTKRIVYCQRLCGHYQISNYHR
jgi:hypothetical protein